MKLASNCRGSCDNCAGAGDVQHADVTEFALSMVSCVQAIMSRNKEAKPAAVYEIMRGSQAKAVVDQGYNAFPCWGKLRTWKTADVKRLGHKLILDGILEEFTYSVDAGQFKAQATNLIIGKKGQVSTMCMFPPSCDSLF
jgi:superfamily II DNA helicase RecQ